MASQSSLEIPIVDISSFTSNDDLEFRRKMAHELAAKTHINGAIGIKGHGISPERLDKAFSVIRTLFDLPYDEKMKAPHPNGRKPYRGYSGVNRERVATKTAWETSDEAEKARLSAMIDHKESYEIGSDENHEQYNIWLPEEVFPGFRQFATDLYWELTKKSLIILDILIMGLDLTDDEAAAVRELHSGHDNQLRLAHYPPVESEMLLNANQSRLGPHTDWSFFTLLFQDSHGGLEFVDRKTKQFIPATPQEGVLYLNIGDIFERLSNGFYPSALHRVTLPKVVDGEKSPSRYSMPFFLVAGQEDVIGPMPSRIAIDGKREFEPVTQVAHFASMFTTTNFYS